MSVFRTLRRSRARRSVVTSLLLLLSIAGLAGLPPTPAQAGDADSTGKLTAAVYDDTGYEMSYVEGWSLNGFSIPPSDVTDAGGSLYGLTGSDIQSGGICFGTWKNSYNGWFTYRVDVLDAAPEFVTVSIHGTRSHSTGVGCGNFAAANDVYPALDVWITSTAPPSSWRWTDGAPPGPLASPELTYTHNQPYLFDQTILPVEGPGHGRPAIVSLGDSTISGEGGRWAGNTNTANTDRIDAGAQWYWDTPSGESIPGCHRSESAEVYIGGGYRSENLACSAATTYSYDWQYPQGWRFKPGVDGYCEQDWDSPTECARQGQLISLYEYAKTHNVTTVVLAVGANDFDFSGVVRQCMEIYVTQHFFDTGARCYNSGIIQSTIADANRAKIRGDIFDSLRQMTVAMAAAGYNKDQYSVILQNYWSAIPNDDDIRIPDDYYRRQSEGGCPLLNPDATVLNSELLPALNDTVLGAARDFRSEPYFPKMHVLDVSHALDGHRLCEKGVGDIEDVLPATAKGTDPSSADKLEWVTQARLDVVGTPYTIAEGGHANYWGQLAERNCLRQVVNQGDVRDGSCTPSQGGGVDVQGEPNMTLSPYSW